jgi:hypothetical protein
MKIHSKIALSVCLLSLTCGAALAEQANRTSDRDESKERFLRVLRDSDGKPTALETSIVHCAPLRPGKRGPTVDLVAAVHIAEKSYYRQLNKEFAGYDVVLYEMVAPEGKVILKGGESTSLISKLQKALKDILQLEFQLEVVDYTPNNMLHADMSPEQFAKSMQDRGESIWTMVLRMLGYALARQSQRSDQPSEIDLLLALFDKHRALALKRILAEEFVDMEGSVQAMDGPKGSTLISQRNKVVIESLQKQIAAGKQKIAIFYGAGHMPNLQQRLRDECGLAPVGTRWLVAWDLTPKADGGEQKEQGKKSLSPAESAEKAAAGGGADCEAASGSNPNP